MYRTFDYLNFLLIGYCISTIIFLIAAAISKRFKILKSDYLDVANCLLLIVACSVALITAIGFINNAQVMQNDISLQDHLINFVTTIILIGIVPLIFFFRRLRRKSFTTIIVLACVSWFLFYERIYIWMTSFYRDYLPSSWSMSYSESPLPYIVTATIIYFGLAFILAKKRSERLT